MASLKKTTLPKQLILLIKSYNTGYSAKRFAVKQNGGHMDRETCLATIIEQEGIFTVFQPIVSLENGSVYGYEALSRISVPDCGLNIEELFNLAHKTEMLWPLEKLCRKKALENAAVKPQYAMIFLNVDANIIHDPDFQSGFTAEKLREYDIPEDNIVFEITERAAIDNIEVFTSSVRHYHKQNYKIAVDDFGSGYSGLNRVCAISPEFLKIDMQLIRDVNNDPIKKSAVSSMVDFCKHAGIKVIAEGIETQAELKALIRMGVAYGQGYYFARPDKEFIDPDIDLKQKIKSYFNKTKLSYTPTFFGKVAELGAPKPVVKLEENPCDVYIKMENDGSISEFFVTDEENNVCGILTRRRVFEMLMGQTDHNLSNITTIANILQTEFLMVDGTLPVDKVAEFAMKRASDDLYDSIAITKDGKYLCTVTIKDLLLSSIQVQLKRAADANPLTGLPGNHQIQQVIGATFIQKEPWAIIYLDLDNFKAYNDAYGFSNGDLMIKAVAKSLEICCVNGEFFGHIGGDDFVVIAKYHNVSELCSNICGSFSKTIETLYSDLDWKQGFIVSKNRNGFTENFNIASLSIAVVTNKNFQPKTIEELSKLIANTKKIAKQKDGNAIIIV